MEVSYVEEEKLNCVKSLELSQHLVLLFFRYVCGVISECLEPFNS